MNNVDVFKVSNSFALVCCGLAVLIATTETKSVPADNM